MKPIVFSVAVLLAVLLSSCSDDIDCQGNFSYQDQEFSSEQNEWIRIAADRWNAFIGRDVVVVSPGARDICSINVNVAGPGDDGSYHPQTGFISVDVNKITANHQMSAARFQTIVAHEIGHGLGFPHIGSKPFDALMNHDAASNFTQIDKDECIRLGLCQ